MYRNPTWTGLKHIQEIRGFSNWIGVQLDRNLCVYVFAWWGYLIRYIDFGLDENYY